MSAAHKKAIRRALLRAAKHNPKVISKRWFLKRASIVNFSLPTTIRLTPAANAAGTPVSNDDPKLGDYASLDLGPSLGTRTIGLGGSINAVINFNDAFDGGQFGDVKLSIPSGGNLKSTAVPLLSNTDTSDTSSADHKAPANQLDGFILGPTGAQTAGGTLNVTFDGGANTASVPIPSGTVQSSLQAAIAALPNPIGAGTIGTDGVYVYVTPFATATPPLSAACGSLAAGCQSVQIVFTGSKFNGKPIPQFAASPTGASPFAVVNVHRLVNGYDPADPTQNPLWDNNASYGGCGSFTGNGLASPADSPGTPLGNDVDLLSNLSNSKTAGNPNNLGAGPYGQPGATAADTVLRTNALTISVATPGTTATVPGDGATKSSTIGANGGRANLFGSSVNGLGAGNSVDVTVNLETDINDIARQVDGAWPTPGGQGVEPSGNVSAYSNCRQAWTGKVHNYLTGIKLAGSLKISPAITADGKLRIAKVNLSTPTGSEAKESLAACLEPYSLYMQANPFVAPTDTEADPSKAPNLAGGLAANFNPLSVLYGSIVGAGGLPDPAAPLPAAAPSAACNASGGPLNRAPFGVTPFAGGSTLTNLLSTGAAVGVAGDLAVKKLKAEVLIGANQ